MKKTIKRSTKRVFLPIIFIIAIVLLMGGCKDRIANTKNGFSEIMEAKGFMVTDATDQVTDDSCESITFATSPDETYKIEFYVMSTVENAEQMYGSNLELFKDSFSGSYVYTSVGNAANYAATSNDTFAYISRIDNTLLYVVTSKEKKDEIRTILNELGY